MPCPTYSDTEILDRIEADVRSTLQFLKVRILAQYTDLQTIPRMDIHSEWTAKLIGEIETDLIADAVTHLRAKMTDAAEYRAGQVAADRALSAAE